MERLTLNPVNLCGHATDGALSMTGRTNGFSENFVDAVGAHDIVVCHCIIHQSNLCTNVLAVAEVMKNAVQGVNYIRTRVLNHRQFKAFLEYLDCYYPDVVYFFAVRWLSRAATLKRVRNMREKIKLSM